MNAGQESLGRRRQFVQRVPQKCHGPTDWPGQYPLSWPPHTDHLALMRDRFDFPLVLMQQRNDINQTLVLLVIPPHPGAAMRKAQLLGIRIDHRQRPQQALGILMLLNQVFGVIFRQQTGQGAGLPLALLDGGGLLPAFVDGQYNAPVQ